ncbi:RimJ/RimL family protein N-acetyltransferase [Yoonia maricola]|uniref:RimJ/RimL family protein N-acetyltransferase n=1 Tax=Yoonia maricola TaxID=420999 RepID=A0A2M8WK59_9RHOB|nr:GNAT family N-acetyltransferase [Yoonia maricola]PJI91314.1 RimJ/RimL family protein N-acetyltransferase [Yoonia maricola]
MRRRLVPIVTSRLTIRELSKGDLEPVFLTLGSETSGGRIFETKTVSEAERWLNNRIAEHSELGYSIWAVETKDAVFVGVCGLIPWEPFPMICYAIRKQYQGRGYGTEAAKAVIERASEEFSSIISTIRISNTESIRVAEKIGMQVSDTSFSEDPMLRSYLYP